MFSYNQIRSQINIVTYTFFVDKDVEEAVTETLLTKDILKNGGSVENDDVTQLNGSNIDKYADLLLVNYINLI